MSDKVVKPYYSERIEDKGGSGVSSNRLTHAQAHGAACECRAFEVEGVIAETAGPGDGSGPKTEEDTDEQQG